MSGLNGLEGGTNGRKRADSSDVVALYSLYLGQRNTLDVCKHMIRHCRSKAWSEPLVRETCISLAVTLHG